MKNNDTTVTSTMHAIRQRWRINISKRYRWSVLANVPHVNRICWNSIICINVYEHRALSFEATINFCFFLFIVRSFAFSMFICWFRWRYILCLVWYFVFFFLDRFTSPFPRRFGCVCCCWFNCMARQIAIVYCVSYSTLVQCMVS